VLQAESVKNSNLHRFKINLVDQWRDPLPTSTQPIESRRSYSGDEVTLYPRIPSGSEE
jgi:hypothetical protein